LLVGRRVGDSAFQCFAHRHTPFDYACPGSATVCVGQSGDNYCPSDASSKKARGVASRSQGEAILACPLSTIWVGCSVFTQLSNFLRSTSPVRGLPRNR